MSTPHMELELNNPEIKSCVLYRQSQPGAPEAGLLIVSSLRESDSK